MGAKSMMRRPRTIITNTKMMGRRQNVTATVSLYPSCSSAASDRMKKL